MKIETTRHHHPFEMTVPHRLHFSRINDNLMTRSNSSQTSWKWFVLLALVVRSGEAATNGVELLSAYLGAINVPSIAFFTVMQCNPNVDLNADGMPLTFDTPILESTIQPSDFIITQSDGSTTSPTCASLRPANGIDEGYTVLLAGDFATMENLPISVQIASNSTLQSKFGVILAGLSIKTITYGFETGPSVLLAFYLPTEGQPQRIQVIFDGGITSSGGQLFTNLTGFVFYDGDNKPYTPTRVDDDGDGDNVLILHAPLQAPPIVSVYVDANNVFDPLNVPNRQASSVLVQNKDGTNNPPSTLTTTTTAGTVGNSPTTTGSSTTFTTSSTSTCTHYGKAVAATMVLLGRLLW